MSKLAVLFVPIANPHFMWTEKYEFMHPFQATSLGGISACLKSLDNKRAVRIDRQGYAYLGTSLRRSLRLLVRVSPKYGIEQVRLFKGICLQRGQNIRDFPTFFDLNPHLSKVDS